MKNPGSMSPVHKVFLVGLAGAVMLITLAGCSIFGIGPDAYKSLHSVLTELDLGDAGDVVDQDCYGAGGIDDQGPTCVAVVGGPHADSRLRSALAAAGYDLVDDDDRQSSWRRNEGGHEVRVELQRLEDGDPFNLRDEVHLMEGPGARLSVLTS